MYDSRIRIEAGKSGTMTLQALDSPELLLRALKSDASDEALEYVGKLTKEELSAVSNALRSGTHDYVVFMLFLGGAMAIAIGL